MPDDVMALIAQARPTSVRDLGTPDPSAFRRAKGTPMGEVGGRTLTSDDLVVSPGLANYKSKIPNPPCAQCSADHNPISEKRGDYDHPYRHPSELEGPAGITVLDTNGVAAAPVSAAASLAPSTPATQRISIYASRKSEAFIVNIETAPDWDIDEGGTFKLTEDELLPVLPLLRKLGVKIKDNTGEIHVLEMERADAREHTQANGRGPQGTGNSRQNLSKRESEEPDPGDG